MSATVISSDSPIFECQSPACYIDAESIDTSFVYDSNYAPSCDPNDLILPIGGSDGSDGSDGTDGRGIVDIIRTAGDGSAGTTDTYTINYTTTPLTSTYDVVMGTDGATGAQGITGDTGDTGATGANGNDGTDGATITADASDPTILNPGNNGDLHIRTTTYDLYEKAAGTWSIIGNVQGAAGAAGAAGSDGIDGDQWTFGAIVPTSTTINAFDEYYVLTTTKDVYLKLEGATTWAIVFNLNGDTYATTSTTSVNLTTTTIGDTVILTVSAGLAWSIGQFAVVANSTTEQFTGKVTSYSSTTLTLVVTYILGTATLTSWNVNLAGVVESGSVPGWYTVTATAGGGVATARTFTAPAGWTVDTSDVIQHPNLTITNKNVTFVHPTGLACVDVKIWAYGAINDTNSLLNGTVAWSSITETGDHAAFEVKSISTLDAPLIIYIKLT